MPPKAPEVRRIARQVLDPALSGIGFQYRVRPQPRWTTKRGDATVTFRLLFSPWNYGDAPTGYEFTGELEVETTQPVALLRLFHGLSDAEREDFRRRQNLVIAKIPVDEAELDALPPEWQADRLAQVAPRWAPYPRNVEVWFRYIDETDVRRWRQFIADVLPGCVELILQPASGHIGGPSRIPAYRP